MLSRAEEYDELFSARTRGVYMHAQDRLIALPSRVVINGLLSPYRPLNVFAHELTHRFVNECFPDAPAWLDEGLASVFEVIRIDGQNVVVGPPGRRIGEVYLASVRWMNGQSVSVISQALAPPPSRLVTMTRSEFYHPHDSPIATNHHDGGDDASGAAWLRHPRSRSREGSVRSHGRTMIIA